MGTTATESKVKNANFELKLKVLKKCMYILNEEIKFLDRAVI